MSAVLTQGNFTRLMTGLPGFLMKPGNNSSRPIVPLVALLVFAAPVLAQDSGQGLTPVKGHAADSAAAAGEAQAVEKSSPNPKAAPTSGVFKDTLKDGTSGPEMIGIKGGCYQMGSPQTEMGRFANEEQHEVCVKDFAIGRYEVTFAEYDRFAKATGAEKPDSLRWAPRGRNPVIYVSWNDAAAYAEWLSKQTGKAYRLPTEAEWEYTARAGTSTPFFTGACINTEQANYNGNNDYAGCGAKTDVYRKKTLHVGSLATNPWGLYDVHGNVQEWTCSRWEDNQAGEEKRCAQMADDGDRVIRGGSWYFRPQFIRSAMRDKARPGLRGDFIGFRLARD